MLLDVSIAPLVVVIDFHGGIKRGYKEKTWNEKIVALLISVHFTTSNRPQTMKTCRHLFISVLEGLSRPKCEGPVEIKLYNRRPPAKF